MSRCFTWFPNWLVLGEPKIYHDLEVFYKEVGRLWRNSAPELMGVKLVLDNVQLVLLKKYGIKFIIVPVWDSFLSVYHKFGSSNTWELSKSK